MKVGKEDSPHSVSYQCEWREFMPGQRQPGSLESVASEECVSLCASVFFLTSPY